MKKKELEAMSEKDITDKLNELYKELIKVNAQVAVGTNPKSPGKIRQMKKTIAALKTIAHRRSLTARDVATKTRAETVKKEAAGKRAPASRPAPQKKQQEARR